MRAWFKGDIVRGKLDASMRVTFRGQMVEERQ